MEKGHFYSLKIEDNEIIIEATGKESGNILAIKEFFKYRVNKKQEIDTPLPNKNVFNYTLELSSKQWNAYFEKSHIINNEISRKTLPLYMKYNIIFNRYYECLKEL